MQVRIADLLDIPAIVAMAGRFHAATQYKRVAAMDVGRAEAQARQMIEGETGCILLVGHPKAVGMMGLLRHENWISGETFVTELFWWVDDRDMGAGSALLNEAEFIARESGAAALSIIVPADLPWLGEVLEKRGFAPLETAWFKRFE